MADQLSLICSSQLRPNKDAPSPLTTTNGREVVCDAYLTLTVVVPNTGSSCPIYVRRQIPVGSIDPVSFSTELKVDSLITETDAPVSNSMVIGQLLTITERKIGLDPETTLNRVYDSGNSVDNLGSLEDIEGESGVSDNLSRFV